MIRFLRAFGWLRWRLLVNGLKGGGRRDALERFSRFAAVLVPAILLVTFLGMAAALGLLGFLGGLFIGAGRVAPGGVLIAIRAVLLVLLVVPVIAPVIKATQGGVAGYTRLMLLPIPRGALHRVEVLASLADPWIAVAVPALLLFPAGLLLAGRLRAATVSLVAALATILLVASLSSLVSFLMEGLMRNRRRAEIFTFVFIFVLSLAGLVPALFSSESHRKAHEARAAGERHPPVSAEQFDRQLPAWSRALPSELHGRAIRAALDGRSGSASLALGALIAEALALFGLSAGAHRRLLGTAESGGGHRRAAQGSTLARRLPGLTQAASAVAIAQVRTALRSVRGRLSVLLPGPFLAILGLMSRRIPGDFPGGTALGSRGYVLLGAGIIFCIWSFQAFFLNQFAADRAGLSLQFLAPIPEEDLVKGKAVGCGIVLAASVLLCLVGAWIVAPGGTPFAWLSVLLGGAATYMLQSPVAALLSALFPVPADLSRPGKGGNPHGLAMLVGTVLVPALAGPPALLIGVVGHALGHHGLAFSLVVLWTAMAVAVTIPLLGLAARAVGPRRENLALVAQGR